jgi:hypothetical protein
MSFPRVSSNTQNTQIVFITHRTRIPANAADIHMPITIRGSAAEAGCNRIKAKVAAGRLGWANRQEKKATWSKIVRFTPEALSWASASRLDSTWVAGIREPAIARGAARERRTRAFLEKTRTLLAFCCLPLLIHEFWQAMTNRYECYQERWQGFCAVCAA